MLRWGFGGGGMIIMPIIREAWPDHAHDHDHDHDHGEEDG